MASSCSCFARDSNLPWSEIALHGTGGRVYTSRPKIKTPHRGPGLAHHGAHLPLSLSEQKKRSFKLPLGLLFRLLQEHAEPGTAIFLLAPVLHLAEDTPLVEQRNWHGSFCLGLAPLLAPVLHVVADRFLQQAAGSASGDDEHTSAHDTCSVGCACSRQKAPQRQQETASKTQFKNKHLKQLRTVQLPKATIAICLRSSKSPEKAFQVCVAAQSRGRRGRRGRGTAQ